MTFMLNVPMCILLQQQYYHFPFGKQELHPTWPWTLAREWGSHNFSEEPVPVLHHPHNKDFFPPISNLNLFSSNLNPSPHVLSLHTLVKSTRDMVKLRVLLIIFYLINPFVPNLLLACLVIILYCLKNSGQRLDPNNFIKRKVINSTRSSKQVFD